MQNNFKYFKVLLVSFSNVHTCENLIQIFASTLKQHNYIKLALEINANNNF
jgi:hypothetical protein